MPASFKRVVTALLSHLIELSLQDPARVEFSEFSIEGLGVDSFESAKKNHRTHTSRLEASLRMGTSRGIVIVVLSVVGGAVQQRLDAGDPACGTGQGGR